MLPRDEHRLWRSAVEPALDERPRLSSSSEYSSLSEKRGMIETSLQAIFPHEDTRVD